MRFSQYDIKLLDFLADFNLLNCVCHEAFNRLNSKKDIYAV